MLIPRSFTQFVASIGRSLAEVNRGSNEIALTPLNALKAIDILSGSHVAVLGGDVLSDASGKLVYTHVNWYCEQMPGENPIEFSDRSQSIARAFINDLVKGSDKNMYVVLVCSELGVINNRGNQ